MKLPADIVQALLRQDLAQVKRCLSSPGFDVNITALPPDHMVLSRRHQTLLQLAISAPDYKAIHLDAAKASSVRVEIVQALLDAGADPDAVGEVPSPTALLLAVSGLASRATPVVAALLNAGADPNMKSPMLRTALHMAVLPNRVADDENLSTVRLLLEHGADPNLQDDTRKTPLHWAFGNEYHHEVLVLLHEHGARWDIADNKGETPLDLLRKQDRARADWWEAYPGFRDLEDKVAPARGTRTGNGPRF